MNQRTQSILEAAVKDYIKTGEPVSSKGLAKKYKFGVKDATVRAELNRLTKEGFLAQLHTSGGRVPTNKGYELFVEEALDDASDAASIIKRYKGLASDLHQGRIRDFVEAISDETRLLGAGQQAEHEVYKSGLDELVDKLDIEARGELQEIVRDFELLDQRFESFKKRFQRILPEPQVFIGKRSPITESENLSVIMDNYELPDGSKVFVALIGPKRMDYEKNVQLFKALRGYISD